MLLKCFIIVISEDTLYHDVKVTVCASALEVIVWGNLVSGNANFEECFVALHMISVCYPSENSLE
jgi:hypothetical protein